MKILNILKNISSDVPSDHNHINDQTNQNNSNFYINQGNYSHLQNQKSHNKNLIIPLLGVISTQGHILDPILVYPYIESENINADIFRAKSNVIKSKNMNLSLFPLKTLKKFFFDLCNSVLLLHQNNIMHRDIKPHNIAYDEKRNIFFLLDFGLSEFYIKNYHYSCRVASRYYKSPELLCGKNDYDFKVDIWSVGVVVAGFILGCEPLFKENTDMKMALKISKILGTEEMLNFIDKNKLETDFKIEMIKNNIKKSNKIEWSMLDNNNGHYIDEEVEKLMNGMLKIDPDERMNIYEVLESKWFDEVRNEN